MTERLHVFWDNHEQLVPEDSRGSPPPHVKEVIDEGALLYADPTVAELVANLPAKTSIRGDGNDIENLYFQYQRDVPDQLLEGVADLVDYLHQSQEMWNALDNPDGSEFSQHLLDSGVFDEYWHFKNPDTGAVETGREPYPLTFSDVEPDLPPLKAVHERALLNIFRDCETTLKLGIADISTAMGVIAYLIEEQFDTTVAICGNTNADLDEPDVVLIPDKRNFEALDTPTKNALKESFDSVTENIQEWFTQRGLDAIQRLVEDQTVPRVATLRDLETIINYIEHDIGGGIRSDTGKRIVKDYNEVSESDHLSETEKAEIRGALLDTLQTERDTLARQITDEKSRDLTEHVREIGRMDLNPQKEYKYYRLLDEILDKEQREEIEIGSSSVPEPVVEFAETYRGVVSTTGLSESVEGQIRERIQQELDSHLEDTRDHVIDAVVEEFERLISNVALPNDRLSREQRLDVLKLTRATLEDRESLRELERQYDDANHVGELVECLRGLVDRDGIDGTSAERVETQVESLCDQKIGSVESDVQREYAEKFETAVENIAEANVPPEEKASQLKSVKQIMNGQTPSELGNRAAPVQNIHSTVESLDNHTSLSESLKQESRTTVLKYLEKLEAEVQKQVEDRKFPDYVQEMRQQFDILAKEQTHAPEYIVETLDEVERVVESKRYLDTAVLHHDNKYVRKVSAILHDEFEDRVMRDDEKETILNEIQNKRSIYDVDDQPDQGTFERILDSVPGVVKWAVGGLFFLTLLLLLIMGFLWATGELSNPASQVGHAVAVAGAVSPIR